MAIRIESERVACESFIGFGAEWDVRNYRPMEIGNAEWAVIAERVRWMDLPAARTMMQAKWCVPEAGSIDYDTPQMNDLYRLLDICEELGTTVFLSEWGCMPEWLSVPGIDDVADPQYAEIIGEYMVHLIEEKGYSCIEYFVFGNEPNLEVGDFELWREGIENVADEFEARGISNQVTITGPDETHDEAWLELAASHASETIGVYDSHRYARDEMVRPGGLRDHFEDLGDIVREHDPEGDAKPHIVGEAGLGDDADHPKGNRRIDSFYYGLFMADYAVQAANAGMAAVMCWMLEDNAHPGFYWGLWTNAEEGMDLRPWFAAWSLLCRLFPSGCQIGQSPIDDADLRLLAAQIDDGWSVCLVNRSAEGRAETLQFDEADEAAAVRTYRYSEGDTPTDDRGFPVPADERRRAIDDLSVQVPGESVVFLEIER